MIVKFMEKDLVKMLLYGSCARGDFKEHSDVDIALLTQGKRKDNWKYNDNQSASGDTSDGCGNS